jgi:hypothetical protein
MLYLTNYLVKWFGEFLRLLRHSRVAVVAHLRVIL